jgi:hypothetical protein
MQTAQLANTSVALALSLSALPFAVDSMQARTASPTSAVHEIWMEPTDLEQRDLYRGPTMGPAPPAERSTFTFVEKDESGRSPGYDARDANGITWSVKYGPEAQSEVVSSRILWAIGFHQPPTFYLKEWQLTSEGANVQDEHELRWGGRFRPEVPGWRVVADRWDWTDNPHMTWRPHAGLLVAQMFINNWDLKDSNNKLYEVSDDSPGPRRRYVVRDLGASLGSNEQSKWWRWTQLRQNQGSKNDLAGFLESGFIERVKDGRVVFAYSGPNEPLVSNITPADVRWTMRLLARLSDRQWRDAFRAGGYSEGDTARYVARFKERIATGLALH